MYGQTVFTSSAARLDQLPDDVVREVAFAGRSNAGKSSAINRLTGNRKLARTSKTPGRTQLINHFKVTQGAYLVDLPGYGYARVSKSQRNQWHRLLHDYFVSREQLRCLIVVMDVRHPLTDNDWQMVELQQQSRSLLHVLLTKTDKLSRSQANRNLIKARDELQTAGVEASLQTFSASNGEGLKDLVGVLDENLFEQPSE